MATYFAAIDWASRTHALCVIDEHGTIRLACEIEHTADGLARLLRELRRFDRPEQRLRIAIERPSGLLVDTLVEAGFTVVPVHPNILKAARPRYRSHGGKTDASDAYMLADLLRTDGHRLRPLAPRSDAIRALRSLVRTREDLQRTRTRLTNQLRDLLLAFWPGATELFAELDSPIALAFLERYPGPQTVARLGPKRMAAFLATHRYSGRRSPEDLLARLHAAAPGQAGELLAEADAELVQHLVAVLRTLCAQMRLLDARIEHTLADVPDGTVLMSFPRAGRLCAAQILAELGDVRERFPSDAHLAAEAGVAPVTHASGKHRAVVWRWACNKRLRFAITTLADNSRHASPWAAAVYARARARGARHTHAVRILARAWVRVIWRAWTDRRPYDPALHNAARLLLDAPGG
jgi:transposase